MIHTCLSCQQKLNVPDYSEEQKLELWALKAQDFQLFAIQKIMDWHSLSCDEAKAILGHINLIYGHCIRCENTNLNTENTPCNSCQSFNLNWKINQSFNAHFCEHLEYHLSGTFSKMEDPLLKGFWCDGIAPIASNYTDITKSKISLGRRIITKAWLGPTGQEHYQMILTLGPKALQNYQEGKSLLDCIPPIDSTDWFKINIKNKIIELNLG